MGYSTLSAQGLSAPPYLFSFFVVLATAALSDRTRTRSTYIIAHSLISATSYAIIAIVGYFHPHSHATLSVMIRYFCVYPAAAGFFSAITLIITWTMDNQKAKEGKGTGMAILNLIGQCGPLLGARLYPSTDGPYYVAGMSVCALAMVTVALLALGLRMLLQRENARAERAAQQAADRGDADGDGGELGHAEAERLMGGGGPSGRAVDAGEEKRSSERFVYIV
jgi:MFS family permease